MDGVRKVKNKMEIKRARTKEDKKVSLNILVVKEN